MDILSRLDLDKVKDKSISEYTATELAAYLVQKFSEDPVTHLQILRCNGDIGSVLYGETSQILKGAGYDKREETCGKVSIERNIGGLGNKNRTAKQRIFYSV